MGRTPPWEFQKEKRYACSCVPLQRMFSKNICLRGGLAPARAYLPELLNEVLTGRLDPSPNLDLSVSLDEVAAGYAAMDQRRVMKVMVRP